MSYERRTLRKWTEAYGTWERLLSWKCLILYSANMLFRRGPGAVKIAPPREVHRFLLAHYSTPCTVLSCLHRCEIRRKIAVRCICTFRKCNGYDGFVSKDTEKDKVQYQYENIAQYHKRSKTSSTLCAVVYCARLRYDLTMPQNVSIKINSSMWRARNLFALFNRECGIALFEKNYVQF